MRPPNFRAMNATRNTERSSGHADSFSSSSQIPWAEIFSRHESVLSSHLEFLNGVKNHISSDDEALRAMSTMVNKTVQAMNQFKVVRKYMLNTKSSDRPSSTSQSNGPGTPTSQPSDQEQTTRRKRSRADKDAATDSQWQSSNVHDDPPASKRKRDVNPHPLPDFSQPPYHDGPESHETEDISEEVQRRLRIKEERRRKKEVPQSEKRKRESMLSNESLSPGPSRHRKKRVRVEDEPNESQMGFGAESIRMRKAKRMR